MDYLEELGEPYKGENGEMIVIAHGDALEDAEFLKNEIETRLGYHHFMITNVGPIIGTHTGASIIVLACFGKARTR